MQLKELNRSPVRVHECRERASICLLVRLFVCFADVGVEREGGEREEGGREGGLVAVDVQMCIMLKGCEWGGVT